MNWFKQLLYWLEFMGGEVDEPPPGFPKSGGWILLAIWWGVMICAIAVFCGQTSKFIYIDF